MTSIPPCSAGRLILLGASNLTRGFPVAVQSARGLFGVPLEIGAAMGHGRSYGLTSRVLGRSLPSLLDCGIWRSNLVQFNAASPAGPSLALITDIGNDIMYQAAPQSICAWIEQCLNRLKTAGFSVAMTTMPVESIGRVRPWQFKVLRAILYPTRWIAYDEVRRRVARLDELMRRLAADHHIPLIELPAAWYGADPIHIQRTMLLSAWQEILSAAFASHLVSSSEASSPTWPTLAQRLQLRLLTPEHWWLLGLPLGRTQPAATYSDGTTISLY